MLGIQKTKDYSLFRNVRGNRNIKPIHVADLTSSILSKNMLAVNPILVNANMEVIDGQHRLEVARNNELDIYYLVLENATIDEVIKLNASNRAWEGKDYVNSYADRGNKDFVWLRDFMSEYAISLTTAMIFVMNTTHWAKTYIKNGRLSLSQTQKDLATERADLLYDLRPYLYRKGLMPKSLVQALCVIHAEGLGKKLVKAVQEKGKQFTPENDIKRCLIQLRSYLK